MSDRLENRVCGVCLYLTGSTPLYAAWTDHTVDLTYDGKNFVSATETDFSALASHSVDLDSESCEISNLPIGSQVLAQALFDNYPYNNVEVAVYDFDLSDGSLALPEDDNLVGHWPMDEGTGSTTEDVSGNENDGTLENTPIWVDGISGKALSFDGIDQCVSISDDSMLNMGTEDFSISLWLKNSTTAPYRIFCKRVGTSGYEIYLDNASNYLRAFLGDADSYSYGALSTANIRDGAWHHIVVVFDRDGYMTGYVDGVVGSTPIDITDEPGSATVSSELVIGSTVAKTSQFFEGNVDEVRIYDRVLTQSEITALYNYPGGNTGLVCHWKFDEGRGTVAYDSSGHDNDGNLTNMEESDWVDGISGKCLRFDGTDDIVDCTGPRLIRRDLPWTVSWWWINKAAGDQPLLRDCQSSTDRQAIYYENGALAYAYYVGAGWQGYSVDVPDGDHFLTITSDGGSNMKIFVDGIEATGGGTTLYTSYTSGNFILGHAGGYGADRPTNYMEADVDDLRVYQRALSETEVYALYKNRGAPFVKTLWKGKLYSKKSHLLRNYISITSRNAKYYSDVVAGLVCAEQCAVARFGDAVCQKVVFTQTVVIDLISGPAVEFAVAPAGVDHLYRSGYIEYQGLEIKILDWSSTPGDTATLAQTPPDSWLGATVNIYAGCDRTYGTCADIHNNTENMLALGLSMVDYNTYFETT